MAKKITNPLSALRRLSGIGVGRNANGQQGMLKRILNGMEALITVCDADTFEIFFLNDSIRTYFGLTDDGIGQRCYKVLQKLDAPCATCPYQQLRDEPEKTLIWEHHERVKGSILRKTARIIDWPGGKKAHLEYAIDITEAVETREKLTQRENMLEVLNRAAIILLSLSEETFEDTMTAGVNLISSIAKVDRMSVSRNIDIPGEGLCASQIYRWSKAAGTSIPTVDELQGNSYDRQIPRWRDVLSAGECINGPVRLMPEAEALKQFGCVTVLAIPVFAKDIFWGFVLFENLTDEQEFSNDEAEMLRSASFMLANTVIRNEEGRKIRRADEQRKQMIREIEHQNKLLFTVNVISAILLQSNRVTFKHDLLRSMGIMAEAAGADRVYIWENYLSDGELYCTQTYEWSGGAEPLQGKDIMMGVSYRELVPRWERAFLRGNCINGIVRTMPASESAFLQQQGVLSILTVPIFLKDQLWGFVGFDNCHSERVFSEKEEKILRSASELIANALIRNSMEVSILQLEVEADKIYYDPLTGIYNRRFFDENMQRLIRSLSRSNGTLSLMMIDIDYFKIYNDTYGHVEGDNCLKIIAKTLKDSVTRADDFVARYGGEEFVIVLPNTNEDGAHMLASKLLKSIYDCGIPHGKSDAADCVTVSIGVTTGLVVHTYNSDTYVQRADAMLYKSKQEGRNRYAFSTL
ncbi:MAG: diguanylate cyclase [Clostridiales bacterium]|nr:diguanylate cyclase [Clostridiales bacterium]